MQGVGKKKYLSLLQKLDGSLQVAQPQQQKMILILQHLKNTTQRRPPKLRFMLSSNFLL